MHAVEIVRRHAKVNRHAPTPHLAQVEVALRGGGIHHGVEPEIEPCGDGLLDPGKGVVRGRGEILDRGHASLAEALAHPASFLRSEEHTSELQSLMRISYAVFCL